MIPNGIEGVRSFLEKIRHLGFFERLFSWKRVRNGLVDAAAALGALQAGLQHLEGQQQQLERAASDQRKDLKLAEEQLVRLQAALGHSQEMLAEKDVSVVGLTRKLAEETANGRNLEKNIAAQGLELAACTEKIRSLEQRLAESSKECLRLQGEEEQRKAAHLQSIHSLERFQEQVHADREKEQRERNELELARLGSLRETWMAHQTAVKNAIRAICNKHAIEYAEKVPFKGEPDNALKICDEYIVLDAKSPGGETLAHFFAYIKTQAEQAKKYARQENVKADIFFVIPANTLEHVKQNVFHLASYTVYVIGIDSLEPVILQLKKIEEYEFAQQLSPEERENICRVIGRFAHLTKRRIQIDAFFARQFIEVVYKCESSLPDDILAKVTEFERAEKLNPPIEKRAKAINTRQLDLELAQLELEAGSKGIAIGDLSAELNEVRLYRAEE